MSYETSVAHLRDMNLYGLNKWPDGHVEWREASPPDVENGRNTGQLRSCGYCGSMHPADVASAIRAGATGDWADRKYGWPHKAYFDGIPNPHAGMPEVRASSSQKTDTYSREHREPRFDPRTGERVDDYVTYTEQPQPASAKTYGTFYTVHLQDATPEDRATIEQHLRLSFEFSADGRVAWHPVVRSVA